MEFFNWGNLNKLIRLAFLAPFLIIILTACGGGGGEGGGEENTNNKSPETPSETLSLFPLNTNYEWYYNYSANPVEFYNSKAIAGKQISELNHPTGAREYFYTTQTDIQYYGAFIPYIRVQTPNGFQTYTGDLILDNPITFFSTAWTAGHTAIISGNGTVFINPTYGERNITYTGYVSYHGMQTVTVPLGTYDAHRVSFNFTTSTTIQGVNFEIPFSTELWLVDGLGIVRRNESGTSFNLTGINGFPVETNFTATEGAMSLPIAKVLLKNSQNINASLYNASIEYQGSQRNWLNLERNLNNNLYLLQPNTTNFSVGRYSAVIHFTSTTETPFDMQVSYTLQEPHLTAPAVIELDLRGDINIENFRQLLRLGNTGRPVSITGINSSAAWIHFTDVTTDSTQPEYDISLTPSSLFNVTGDLNETIEVRYDNGYGTEYSIETSIIVRLPSDGLQAPVMEFSNISGHPDVEVTVPISLFGELVNSSTFNVSIEYQGSANNWLEVREDAVNGTLNLVTTRTNLPPDTYMADIILTDQNGIAIPIRTEFTLLTPTLSGPTNIQWMIDQNTVMLELTQQIHLRHSGELLDWEISASEDWLGTRIVSNDLANGGIAEAFVTIDGATNLPNGVHEATIMVTYRGNYVAESSFEIPVSVNIDFPVVKYPVPYVLYENQNKTIKLHGEKIDVLQTYSLYINNEIFNDVTIIDDREAMIVVNNWLSGEYSLHIGNALNINRGAGRIVVREPVSYVDETLVLRDRVVQTIFDEERDVFYLIMWDYQPYSDFYLVRMRKVAGTWIYEDINITAPLAMDTTPDGKELLVTTEACSVKHVDLDSLMVSQPHTNAPCYTSYKYGVIAALNDGQVLVGNTGSNSAILAYPDFTRQSTPYVYNPISIKSSERNKMVWAEGASNSFSSLYMYDAKSDTFTWVNMMDNYFAPNNLSLSADGSRFLHHEKVYDENFNYIGSLDITDRLLDRTVSTPDGHYAVHYDYRTKSFSLFDMSGGSGPFPKITSDYPLDEIGTVMYMNIPLDGSMVFMFGFYIDPITNITQYKMWVRNLDAIVGGQL